MAMGWTVRHNPWKASLMPRIRGATSALTNDANPPPPTCERPENTVLATRLPASITIDNPRATTGMTLPTPAMASRRPVFNMGMIGPNACAIPMLNVSWNVDASPVND
jgi:hypothetical protein